MDANHISAIFYVACIILLVRGLLYALDTRARSLTPRLSVADPGHTNDPMVEGIDPMGRNDEPVRQLRELDERTQGGEGSPGGLELAILLHITEYAGVCTCRKRGFKPCLFHQINAPEMARTLAHAITEGMK